MMLRNALAGSPLPRRCFFTKFFKAFTKEPAKRESRVADGPFGKYEVAIPWHVSERLQVPSYIPQPSYGLSGVPLEPPDEIEIKNAYQIECMRHSCMLAKQILRQLRPLVRPGVTTDQLDRQAHEAIISNGAYPSPLNYNGFPKSICTSVNNVACHGIPDSRPLRDGDIVNVDVTVYHNGYHGDCSEMFSVGVTDEEAERLVRVTELCLDRAIGICRPGEKFCNIGNIIEETARAHSLTVIPVFAGHGLGSYFHAPPDIYHFANDYEGTMLPGMTFTIEPVLTQGSEDVNLLDDGWTAVTVDDARTAQIEHTILITDDGCDVLTC